MTRLPLCRSLILSTALTLSFTAMGLAQQGPDPAATPVLGDKPASTEKPLGQEVTKLNNAVKEGEAAKPRANAPDLKLSPEQIDAVVAILREQNMRLADRLEEVRRTNPEHVNAMIAEVWPKIRPLVELKQRDPKLFDLTLEEIKYNRRIDEFVKRAREATDPVKAEKDRADLRRLLAERFAVRQRMRDHEVDLMRQKFERELQKMRDRNDDRQRGMDKTLDEELRKLLPPPKTEGKDGKDGKSDRK